MPTGLGWGGSPREERALRLKRQARMGKETTIGLSFQVQASGKAQILINMEVET